MTCPIIQPSRDLYNKVRAGFIARGTTLHSWCRSQEFSMGNARDCLLGTWDGPKGKALRARIIEASGMSVSSPIEPDNHSTSDQAEATEAEEFFYWGC